MATVVTGRPIPKRPATCRKEIAEEDQQGHRDRAHGRGGVPQTRDKGKFAGDCNDLAHRRREGQVRQGARERDQGHRQEVPARQRRARQLRRTATSTARSIPRSRPPSRALATTVLGAPSAAGDKTRVKCHGEIAKAVNKVVAEILKGSIKCQAGVDKTASDVRRARRRVPRDTRSSRVPRATRRSRRSAPRSRRADVGTLRSARRDGADARAVRSRRRGPPARASRRRSSASRFPAAATACRIRVRTATTATRSTTDGCIACHFAACGDGFVHAGVELCGDAPADACDTPTPGHLRARISVPAATAARGRRSRCASRSRRQEHHRPQGRARLSRDQGRRPGLRRRPVGAGPRDERRRAVLLRERSRLRPRGQREQSGSIRFIDTNFFTVELDNCIGADRARAAREFGCVVLEAFDDQNAARHQPGDLHGRGSLIGAAVRGRNGVVIPLTRCRYVPLPMLATFRGGRRS